MCLDKRFTTYLHSGTSCGGDNLYFLFLSYTSPRFVLNSLFIKFSKTFPKSKSGCGFPCHFLGPLVGIKWRGRCTTFDLQPFYLLFTTILHLCKNRSIPIPVSSCKLPRKYFLLWVINTSLEIPTV